MHVVLFDDADSRGNLLPLTFTRPVSEIRIGILTITEKWKLFPGTQVAFHTQPYLQAKYPASAQKNDLFVNGCLCPNNDFVKAIKLLSPNTGYTKNGLLLAFFGEATHMHERDKLALSEYAGELITVEQPWHIFQKNGTAIQQDFERLTSGRSSQPLSASVTVIGDAAKVFLEPGAKAEACILNTTAGPIYLGADAEIMEGSVVRGPFALCEHSALKMAAKIYGPTTIGPHSKVGGEVNNSVVFGYSNKAHDGFLGNSVIAEWCNLGADTNTSNLKNNYANVKLYNYPQKRQVDTGLQFCGLIMADHSKSGINTMFNTGTVVGVGCNIYGGGFPPTHLPNYSWGGAEGLEPYNLDKLFETAEKVFERRGLQFGETEKQILTAISVG